MKEAIHLIFEALKNKEITIEKAEEFVLGVVSDTGKCYELGKRELSIGEKYNFPPMKFSKSGEND